VASPGHVAKIQHLSVSHSISTNRPLIFFFSRLPFSASARKARKATTAAAFGTWNFLSFLPAMALMALRLSSFGHSLKTRPLQAYTSALLTLPLMHTGENGRKIGVSVCRAKVSLVSEEQGSGFFIFSLHCFSLVAGR
jgi:hypothetical protein